MDGNPAIEALRGALADLRRPAPNLRDVGRAYGLSPFQLIRRFRAAVGLTPIAYRVALRVNYARTLLETRRSITDVAYEAGFSDQSHLNRHFKRVCGVTPGQYLRDVQSQSRRFQNSSMKR